MRFPKFAKPVIGIEVLTFESTRDGELFARTGRELRELELPDGSTVEQYLASGELRRRVARAARVPNCLRHRLPLPTEIGVLPIDEVIVRAAALGATKKKN